MGDDSHGGAPLDREQLELLRIKWRDSIEQMLARARDRFVPPTIEMLTSVQNAGRAIIQGTAEFQEIRSPLAAAADEQITETAEAALAEAMSHSVRVMCQEICNAFPPPGRRDRPQNP